jgi:hypothetical protein
MHLHFFAVSVSKFLYVMIPAALHMEMAATQTRDYMPSASASQRLPAALTWTHSRKKGRLKSTPDRMYLFVTVIKIDEPQYARIAATGFSVIDALFFEEGRMTGEGARDTLAVPLSL